MQIAVVVSGWHFPLSFYEKMAKQSIKADLFCVSHRDPEFSRVDKGGKTLMPKDSELYNKIATVQEIEALGWKYKLYPNTIGDWGNSNQWLAEHDFSEYDLILFTHDDNLILSDKFLEDVSKMDFDIASNSIGDPPGWLRGSCEFFTREALEKIGGNFDLSMVSLNRRFETTSSEDMKELDDWNNTIHPTMQKIKSLGLKVIYLGDTYRKSKYCLEGVRGYLNE